MPLALKEPTLPGDIKRVLAKKVTSDPVLKGQTGV